MSDDELEREMNRTLADIMFLTQRYARQFDESAKRRGALVRTREPQVTVMHYVGWSHLTNDPADVEELHRRLQGE